MTIYYVLNTDMVPIC